MASLTSFKVESGMQLLARITRKPILENFYPYLFEFGPKPSEVIELCTDEDISCLLVDIACTALLPIGLKGIEAGVLICNCSGHFNYMKLISCLRNKIKSQFNADKSSSLDTDKNKCVEDALEKSLANLFLLEIYDSTQLYTTIHNLENILMEHSNISLVIFDTITAFYWSEQSFKIMKMDIYLKKILHKTQRVTKEHNITIIYTRPEYFSSSKDLESLEPCCENSTMERINYRIHIALSENVFKVNVMSYQKQQYQHFCIEDDRIRWLN